MRARLAAATTQRSRLTGCNVCAWNASLLQCPGGAPSPCTATCQKSPSRPQKKKPQIEFRNHKHKATFNVLLCPRFLNLVCLYFGFLRFPDSPLLIYFRAPSSSVCGHSVGINWYLSCSVGIFLVPQPLWHFFFHGVAFKTY